jgi:excisionase family DNA binding protein
MAEHSEPSEVVQDGLLTISEAASFLRISRASLYSLMGSGELSFVKLGRSRRIPKRAVQDLAARNLHEGNG